MLRTFIYWLFLKFEERAEKEKENDSFTDCCTNCSDGESCPNGDNQKHDSVKSFVVSFRRNERRLAELKASRLALQELLRQKKAG